MNNLLSDISNFFHSQIIFWVAWVIIPIIMEIIPTLGNFLILIKRIFTDRDKKDADRSNDAPSDYLPEITVIVPVYNSADMLRECIKSIYDSDYPTDRLSVILANNETKDNCFEIYCACQEEFGDIRMNWINAAQGKSKALNQALFNSEGIYIIHIDSDGILESSALRRMVLYLEKHPKVHCVTGTVLTDPKMIDETENPFARLFRKLEFGEYCQAFLSGRNFQSELNSIFTVSGAFSGFRRSAIFASDLYNFDTLCEDTHVTFQIRDHLNKKVALVRDSFFFVNPIESFNKLYTQRQRWQIGELEVLNMFRGSRQMHIERSYASDFVMRLLVFDHTFAFPRMIWYFALLALAMINYPMRLIVISVLLLFLLYSFANFLLHICIVIFLRDFKELRNYYARKWYLIFLLPLYNFITFWCRFAGIINSMYAKNRAWRSSNLTEEMRTIAAVINKDFAVLRAAVTRLRKVVNANDED